MSSFKFQAIGTSWQIDIYESISKAEELRIKRKVLSQIEKFDKSFSRFRNDSWVVKNSKVTGTVTLPKHGYKLLSIYKSFFNASNGLFTPLIGKTLEDAGYDASYTLKPKENIFRPPSFDEAIEFDDKEIIFKKNLLLDFGAAGKGFLVDLVSNLLKNDGIEQYCIDASGDILHKDTHCIRVGLENPADPTLAIGVCELKNQSICGSSGSRRKWSKYHHTINPFTLKSPEDVKAVWVIADSCALADGLATSLFLDPNPKHYNNFNFEYVLLYKDNTAEKSKDFPGELFTS